jgi:hypothetical protein
MAGLLFHAIETLDSRRHSAWSPQRGQLAAPRLADPHPETSADAETVFHLASIRPLLEAQAGDASHDGILESADVASISVRGSNGYT